MARKKKDDQIDKEEVLDRPIDFKTIEAIVKLFGGGLLELHVRIPEQLKHLASKSLQNYLQLPLRAQFDVNRAYTVRGKLNAKKEKDGGFVFQMGKDGIQQIKKYDPAVYQNDRNTPLRIRSRTIMHLALQEPLHLQKEKLRELYRTYPFYLLKDKPVKLRLKNFYFPREVMKGNNLLIYRTENQTDPDPETDILYTEKEFSSLKTVKFEYEGRDEEYYYAVNSRNGDLSNVLHFTWQDETPQLPAQS